MAKPLWLPGLWDLAAGRQVAAGLRLDVYGLAVRAQPWSGVATPRGLLIRTFDRGSGCWVGQVLTQPGVPKDLFPAPGVWFMRLERARTRLSRKIWRPPRVVSECATDAAPALVQVAFAARPASAALILRRVAQDCGMPKAQCQFRWSNVSACRQRRGWSGPVRL